MKQRELGNTGIKVSEIAFGGVEIGIPYGIGVNSQADMPTDQESGKLLQAALDNGINFFDTARAYGRSESIIGKAFADKRERVVICTKCSHLPSEKTAPDKMRALIEFSLEESLSALQTNYIDVYKLHSANLNILKNETVLDTFSKFKKDGIIRATGVSTYTVEETKTAIEQGVWDVIQLSFNLMDQRQGLLFDMAAKAGVGIVVRSVLLKGILTDKGRNLHPELHRVADHRNHYQELLEKNNPTLSTLATKFALSFSQVSSVLVGIDRMAYLQQAIETANGHYLDSRTLAQAKKLAYPDPEFLDLPRWDRMAWLK
jgi:1-deoxyxylulose-5-phosphate synthase